MTRRFVGPLIALGLVATSTSLAAPDLQELQRSVVRVVNHSQRGDWASPWNVTGVSEGFSKVLEINGVGYKAEVKGKEVHFALGYSHPIVFPIPDEMLAGRFGTNRYGPATACAIPATPPRPGNRTSSKPGRPIRPPRVRRRSRCPTAEPRWPAHSGSPRCASSATARTSPPR